MNEIINGDNYITQLSVLYHPDLYVNFWLDANSFKVRKNGMHLCCFVRQLHGGCTFFCTRLISVKYVDAEDL